VTYSKIKNREVASAFCLMWTIQHLSTGLITKRYKIF